MNTGNAEQDYQDHLDNLTDHDAEIDADNEAWEAAWLAEYEETDRKFKLNQNK